MDASQKNYLSKSLNVAIAMIAIAIICGYAKAAQAAPKVEGRRSAAGEAARSKVESSQHPTPNTRRPSLVVFISIDQLRYEDLLLLAPEFGPGGFAGLGEPGQARYDTAQPETAADHATLSTGAWPAVHGIVANKWVEEGEERVSVTDAACPLWGRPASDAGGRSARSLRAPTIGDALKIASLGHARVVSVGMKDRVALLLGGTSADVALFWDDQGGQFTSTQCYAAEAPQWVVNLNAKHPLASFADYVWTPSRDAALLARYGDPEAAAVEPLNNIGERFPHAVGQGDVSPRLALALRQTPMATTLVLEAARAALEAYALGGRNVHASSAPELPGPADLLMVGIPTIDGVGHQFGAHAPERIDALLRLHDELGAFVRELRASYGDRVAIVLSADHGVTPITAELKKLRIEVPVLDRDAILARLEVGLTQRFGPARQSYVEFFEPPALQLRREPRGPSGPPLETLLREAGELLRKEPGVSRVFDPNRLFADDAQLAAAPGYVQHALVRGRSPDFLMIAQPLDVVKKSADAADHGTPWNDDALVPLLLDTPGFELRPQYRGGFVLATQIAPTLAQLLGIAPPAAAMDQPLLERANPPRP